MHRNFVGSSHIPDVPAGSYRTAAPPEHPVIETIQRIAERVAGGIIAVAPLFWLAFILAFMAVTLGIIPNE